MKRIWRTIEVAIGVLALAFWLEGCASTVAPRVIHRDIKSYDGNLQDSGVIGIRSNGDRIVTADFVARYKSYIAAGLGKYCEPPITSISGLSESAPGVFIVQAQSFVDFCLMRDLKDSGF